MYAANVVCVCVWWYIHILCLQVFTLVHVYAAFFCTCKSSTCTWTTGRPTNELAKYKLCPTPNGELDMSSPEVKLPRVLSGCWIHRLNLGWWILILKDCIEPLASLAWVRSAMLAETSAPLVEYPWPIVGPRARNPAFLRKVSKFKAYLAFWQWSHCLLDSSHMFTKRSGHSHHDCEEDRIKQL